MNGRRDADGGASFEFRFAGQAVPARKGETVGSALWAAGILAWRRSSREGQPRGLLCGMGTCHECLVRIGNAQVRACQVEAVPGLVVEPGGRP